jgi:hypothetical protein
MSDLSSAKRSKADMIRPLSTYRFVSTRPGDYVGLRRKMPFRASQLVIWLLVCLALTAAVFFLALQLLPIGTFTPFPLPRFPGFF